MITQTGIEAELIYRQQAIDALDGEITITGRTNAEAVRGYVKLVKDRLERLPSAQSEIIRCKDCKYWNSGTCECREHVVNCQDYMVGDMETDAEHFCGYAERREVIT